MMTKTGMLVITNPNRFIRLMPRIQKEIKKTLYIQYYPEKKLRLPDVKNYKNRCMHNSSLSSTVIHFYSNTVPYRHLDVRVLLGALRDPELTRIKTKEPVEVVYFDQTFNNEEMQGFLSKCVGNKTSNCELIPLKPCEEEAPESCIDIKTDSFEIFNNVVLGGTFDRLHAGHKIMLSEAILRCKKKVTVGVTNADMLKSKKLWELVEPCHIRISKVKEFLEDVDTNLEYNVVPIADMYGPTKDDPTLEMLVVSSETLGGGSKVNELRKANGLKPLVVHSVDLVNDIKIDEIEEEKISSSNGRLRLLGTRIADPEPRPGLPCRPYIIGLTGGIASGKSSVSERLRSLGAGVINCDHVAHSIYSKGSVGYEAVVAHFGHSVVAPDGEINRAALGQIVFKDKVQLEKLNEILWPLILKRTKEIAFKLFEKGHEVVVIEAAVLIQAGWSKDCHEIWACIIPAEEAQRRLHDRNKMSNDDARARLSAQPTNEEYISSANVVFCTLWKPEYTKKQVDRAWDQLMEIIKK